MAAEDFFRRWAKPAKSPSADEDRPPTAITPATEVKPDSGPKPLPSMADVARLTHESDYSGFLAKGVDEAVKRSALKKLFADPHFKLMDGLDTYVDDYSQPDPLPPGMLAALNHAQALLDPLRQFEPPLTAAAGSMPAPDQAPQAGAEGSDPAGVDSGAASDRGNGEPEHTVEAKPETGKDRA